MKQHPFFEGIDFDAVSSENYNGALNLVRKLLLENKSNVRTNMLKMKLIVENEQLP